ncbi:MAG: DUF2809 domain-containing protein [Pirellulaceae bacterium]
MATDKGDIARPRNRILVLMALLVVVVLGLASRSFPDWLPSFITVHAGDAMWTVAAYLTLALAFPRWAPLRLGLVAFGVSVAVELSQLIDTSWLNLIRQTLPGRLLLGVGFLWSDLLRYLVGAVVVMTLDRLFFQRQKTELQGEQPLAESGVPSDKRPQPE